MIRNLLTFQSHGRGVGRAILAVFVTLAAVVVVTVSAQGGDTADPLAGTTVEASARRPRRITRSRTCA